MERRETVRESEGEWEGGREESGADIRYTRVYEAVGGGMYLFMGQEVYRELVPRPSYLTQPVTRCSY